MAKIFRFDPSGKNSLPESREGDSGGSSERSAADIEAFAREKELLEDALALDLINRVHARTIRNLRESMRGISDFEYLRRLVAYLCQKEASQFLFEAKRTNLSSYREIPAHVAERVGRLGMEECSELLRLVRPDEVDEADDGSVPSFVIAQR